MSILDSLIIIVFSYWIKDLSLISLMKEKKKKKTLYVPLSVEKQQRKEWKINRKKTESPSPKFTACDLIWEKKTKQTRTKTRVKQYKNPPISLFSKS